jgi:N-methylhydantoinase A/oxoprolinase/acetone carboxylase beta subunit
MDLVRGKRSCSTLESKATIDRPVVGLGAPARVFIAPLEKLMHVKVVIPEDHDVGNAVGAICGQVSEYVDVYVYPRDKGYAVFSNFSSPMDCGGEAEAVRRAKALAERYARERAGSAGGVDLKVEMMLEEERGRSNSTLQKDELVQLRVRARAVGRPATGDELS